MLKSPKPPSSPEKAEVTMPDHFTVNQLFNLYQQVFQHITDALFFSFTVLTEIFNTSLYFFINCIVFLSQYHDKYFQHTSNTLGFSLAVLRLIFLTCHCVFSIDCIQTGIFQKAAVLSFSCFVMTNIVNILLCCFAVAVSRQVFSTYLYVVFLLLCHDMYFRNI